MQTELEVHGDFVYRGQGLVTSNTTFIRIPGTSDTNGNTVFVNANSRYDGMNPVTLVINPEQFILSTNNIVQINGEVREIISITNGTHFVVNTAFSTVSSNMPLEVLANTRLVVSGNANVLSEIVRANDNVSFNIFTANVYTAQTGTVKIATGNAIVLGFGSSFNTNLSVNDYIMIANQPRQVINISNATILTVDTPYTSNANGVVYMKRATVQNAKVNEVISNYIDINLAYYGNTTNAVYHVIPNLTYLSNFKIVTLTGN